MRKYIKIFALLTMLLSLSACGANTETNSDSAIQETVETETVDEKIMEMVSERSELKDTTAGNIMKYFVEHDAPNLGGYIERDEETSPVIGKDGLVSKVGFFITTAENVDPDDPFCGTIEAFENKESAKNKYQILKGYFKDGLAKSEYMYLKDCVLMRIKTDVPLEDERKYERLLDKYMLNEYMEENFMLEDITEPTTETPTEADTELETTIPETEAPTEPPTVKETIPETEPTVDYNFISNHKSEIVVSAQMALDRFISGYEMSLAPQLWTIALFDDSGAVMATTDMTYNGMNGEYIYVGTLNLNERGEIESAKPHYVYAMGTVLGDDGYCNDFFETINGIVN